MESKTTTHPSRRDVLRTAGAVGAASIVGFSGTATANGNGAGLVPGRASTLDIVGLHDHDADEHLFELSTNELPSGWTTLAFENRTEHVHFANLTKVPQAAIDGAAAAGEDLLPYWISQITNPFQGLMDVLLGKTPRHAPAFPAWLNELLASGGAGLTAPHTTSTTTVHLDPGSYVLECYVKNGANEFHSYLGMIDLVTVTEEASSAPEPTSTLDLSLSASGIEFDDAVRPGQHTVAVTFEDQQIYANFVGHDVHLLRLDGDTTTAEVNEWMNWMLADGLVADGTEPGTWMGGADTVVTPALLAGTDPVTEYVHVNLDPGTYVWVAEIPDPISAGLLTEFTVPTGRRAGSA